MLPSNFGDIIINIIILNNFWRYDDSDRWDFELVEYEKWLCHHSNQVTYIVNQRGRSCIKAPLYSCAIHEVDDFQNQSKLEEIVEMTITRYGPVDRLIAFSENLLMLAAKLRDKFSIFGSNTSEIERFRNKVLMKQLVSKAGLKVPKFMPLLNTLDWYEIAQFANDVGGPLILKPTDGASSIGVRRIDTLGDLKQALQVCQQGQWQLEEFIEGDVYHVDGLVNTQGQLLFCMSSKYINTCLDFSFTSPLGSIMIEPTSQLHLDIQNFSQDCLLALGLKNSAFHLEIFITNQNKLIFLEVGARVAGADVPYMIAHQTGVNLFQHWFELIIQHKTKPQPVYNGIGAWLMFELPEELPQKVLSVSSFIEEIDSVYRQFLPQVQSLLFEEGGYCSLKSGRFLFSNQCDSNLHQDITHVLEHFSIELQPVE